MSESETEIKEGQRFRSRWKTIRIAYIGIYFVVVVVSLLWPHLPQIPTCLFKLLTGYPCAGCGMTRSFVCAIHGRWRESFEWHPAGLPFFFGFTFVIGAFLWELVRGSPLPWGPWLLRWGKWVAWLALIVFLLTWLLRLSFIRWGVWIAIPLRANV